jgi:bifunctional ADP-heptose synthase (sugar kinase/adenylyltransferase)
MQAVLVTRGSRGMALFEPDVPTRHIPIFGSDEIADVTGAGDTVIATMTLALAAGAAPFDAARLANVAGGLVVMKRGTATVSAAELRAALGAASGTRGGGRR